VARRTGAVQNPRSWTFRDVIASAGERTFIVPEAADSRLARYRGSDTALVNVATLGDAMPLNERNSGDGGWTLSVHTSRQGYWRKHPCGPKNSLRERVPRYLHGAEAAPMSIHPVRLVPSGDA
jgi:hypothetical protein